MSRYVDTLAILVYSRFILHSFYFFCRSLNPEPYIYYALFIPELSSDTHSFHSVEEIKCVFILAFKKKIDTVISKK